MAAFSSPMEPLSRELECGICLEILRDPRILDCSHTFCGPCIPGLVESSRKNIKCPLCQQQTVMPSGGIEALKPNIVARSMAEALATVNPGAIEVGREATEPLPLPQRQSSPTADHSPPPCTCFAHPGQKLQFYCVECKLPVCRQCTVDSHSPPEHTVSDIDNVAGGPRAQIKDLLDLFETEQAMYDQTLQIVKKRNVDFTAAAERTRKDIGKATQMIIADVRTKQQRLLDQVDFITGARKGEIERYVVEMQGVLDEVNDSISKEKNNIEGKDDSAILALHRRIKNGLEKMKQKPSLEVIDGLSFLKFSADRTPAFNLHLGDLIEDEEWSLDSKFGSFGSDIGKFNCARSVAINSVGDIAIAEQRNNRTCIFDTNGKHKVTMSGKSSGNLERGDRDVAFLPDDRCLVIGTSSNVEVYDGKGSHLNCILTPAKSPWCIAVDAGGTIYLGDAGQKMIYIIVDGQVIRSLKSTNQPFHLEVDNEGHMLVSSHLSKRVDVMSTTTGDVLFSIPSTSVDPSNTVSPWGACFGPNGSIFVPFYKLHMSGAGTVHEFDSDGRHVGCVARDLSYPRAVRFTLDERLIVCGGSCIKLYRKV